MRRGEFWENFMNHIQSNHFIILCNGKKFSSQFFVLSGRSYFYFCFVFWYFVFLFIIFFLFFIFLTFLFEFFLWFFPYILFFLGCSARLVAPRVVQSNHIDSPVLLLNEKERSRFNEARLQAKNLTQEEIVTSGKK